AFRLGTDGIAYDAVGGASPVTAPFSLGWGTYNYLVIGNNYVQNAQANRPISDIAIWDSSFNDTDLLNLYDSGGTQGSNPTMPYHFRKYLDSLLFYRLYPSTLNVSGTTLLEHWKLGGTLDHYQDINTNATNSEPEAFAPHVYSYQYADSIPFQANLVNQIIFDQVVQASKANVITVEFSQSFGVTDSGKRYNTLVDDIMLLGQQLHDSIHIEDLNALLNLTQTI